MNVPLSWLLTFFDDAETGQNGLLQKLDELTLGDADLDREALRLEQLVQLLDGLGLSVERTFETPPVPNGVIVAEITSVTPVEGSDHLLLTQVETGSGAGAGRDGCAEYQSRVADGAGAAGNGFTRSGARGFRA